jgi:hypothetical protein
MAGDGGYDSRKVLFSDAERYDWLKVEDVLRGLKGRLRASLCSPYSRLSAISGPVFRPLVQ